MPAIIAWFGTMAGSAIGGWLINALISLGIAVVTYEGIDVTLNFLKAQAVASASGLGPQILGMLEVMRVGSCINIILSAIAVRMGVNGMGAGKIRSFVKK